MRRYNNSFGQSGINKRRKQFQFIKIRRSKMKYQTEIPGFEELKKQITAEQKNFEEQLEEVKKKYPLVAFALSLHDAARLELSHVGLIVDTPMSILYDSLTGRIMFMKPLPPWQRPKWLQLLKEWHECMSGVPVGSPTPIECLEKYISAIKAMLSGERIFPPPSRPPE
jgi:hypothetical protein